MYKLQLFKCNIDASFSQFMNCISIGICVPHDGGAFVLAKAMNFSPWVGEALGLFNAIKWLSDMQMDNVNFMVD